MDNNNRINRRDFLKTSLILAGGATLPLSFFTSSSFAGDEDYKAIVCVLLEGGADAFNMVVPKRNNALYGKYAAVRGDMALTQSELLTLKNTAIFTVCVRRIRVLVKPTAPYSQLMPIMRTSW